MGIRRSWRRSAVFSLGSFSTLMGLVWVMVAPAAGEEISSCAGCHREASPSLVEEWQGSLHAAAGVGCIDCHGAADTDIDAWQHEGAWVATLVTTHDCARCHDEEVAQFSASHHARGGEILATTENVLAETVIGMPGNNADAANGCWQCHGSVVDFVRDAGGNVVRSAEGEPLLDPATWPNSGIGRLNPDGSKGSCNACHSRHAFAATVARAPENCGKCHMGPDHPQIEVYNESKHGIAFHANRDRMALDKEGDWVLGVDYSAAPTCATCHLTSYTLPEGGFVGRTHDVGERLSWTLRPEVSEHINRVEYEDGYKENILASRPLPAVGDTVAGTETTAIGGKLVTRPVTRRVADVVTWQERRRRMQGACLNCHGRTFTDNFYGQFDDLVTLYNDKFARPARELMADLAADGVIDPAAPFTHELQWTYWELWHHEGRRARHGAAMMGPDYTHWHGMYEVAKHFYNDFLPGVIAAAAERGPELGRKYEDRVAALLATRDHRWRTQAGGGR